MTDKILNGLEIARKYHNLLVGRAKRVKILAEGLGMDTVDISEEELDRKAKALMHDNPPDLEEFRFLAVIDILTERAGE